jgi:hypothetical protein
MRPAIQDRVDVSQYAVVGSSGPVVAKSTALAWLVDAMVDWDIDCSDEAWR